ncbi:MULTISPECIES: ScpA family protein [unclassified Coleofasciculus]|nr:MULTISPECIES: ScpA family protein [unclassified Coleofasciculus]MBD1878947.1 segregation/condensation protein A [Coleofasciculus sp. FACHB-T130]MBD1889145.1 segregation/condensation protein A [Coleofasciculus sp. FACHB-SPT9]MBD1893634.1 segregation/condensation protein A [Coleofasciculus sp. FACHB-129]MBD1901489.1 segregation/condensation protein A [Coleofasciculus sp. FACHB-125]MBD1941766.1 segregation/condensation protein A [Coleofasciculus sp. FACHB-712]
MTIGPAQEAIALLIDLAQRGEIDPWDVQVIEAIDRCLLELEKAGEKLSGTFEVELSQSGQAFLYASMLVLLKADTLFSQSLPDNLEPTEDELDDTAADPRQLPTRLERHLRRRGTAMPPQTRRVTLHELIEQLQQIATVLEEKPAGPNAIKDPSYRSQSRSQTARAIAALAHQENLTETAAHLDRFLSSHWPQMSPGQDWLELDQLLELWAGVKQRSAPLNAHQLPEEVETAPKHNDRVGVFWALLLLSAQSKVELAQEEFYQDLKIRTL